jgi:hypothetical protein
MAKRASAHASSRHRPLRYIVAAALVLIVLAGSAIGVIKFRG